MDIQINQLTAAQLKRAAAIKEQIEKLETELAGILGATPSVAPSMVPKKRIMSAAAKAKISLAQKALWAKRKQPQTTAPAKAPIVKKSGMSEETKAKLRAAAKAYWSKKRAGKAVR